jgi:NAD-dependent dihydropyrimidine dehydrogenase PreA subunit
MANTTKSKLSPNDLVLVEWLDAVSVDEWIHSDEANLIEPARCWSCGILVRQCSKDGITLAANHDSQNGNYSCIIQIPKGMILRVKKIGRIAL